MTDRYHMLTVALEQDMRDDDAEALISAIKQLRGVADVTGDVADPTAWAAYARAKHHLRNDLWGVVTRGKP